MRATIVIVLAALMVGAALPAQAGRLEPVLGVGLETEKPVSPPALWAGITAAVYGQEIASLSTDTPVSVVGLRGHGVSYSFRVEMLNLLHVEWVKMGINDKWETCQKQGSSYLFEIPSSFFKPGPNLVRLRIHGRFKTERLNLVLFRVSWRRSDEFEGQITLYMTEASPGTDPVSFFANRGWVPMVDDTPSGAQPQGPLMQYGPPAPAPTSTPAPQAAIPPPPAATAATTPQPVRFYWAGEEVAGRFKIKAGERVVLRVICPTGPTQLRLERPGRPVWEDRIDVDPPLVFNLGRVALGESKLYVKTAQGDATLSIEGVN